MIDTAKLILSFSKQPDWLPTARLQRVVDPITGRIKAIGNPTTPDKKQGIYKPRATYSEQVREGKRRTYQLAIELSLPKLIYGNNFDELTDADFITVTQELAGSLKTAYDIIVTPQQLEQATVAKIDYSKNIIYTDYTPVATIVNAMRKANIAKTYDVQKTDFKNGGSAYHAKHTNGLDVVMYDKITDLKQSLLSPKRSEDKDGYVQRALLSDLEANGAVTVARFEVRINGTRMLRKELTSNSIDCELSFRELFSSDISRKVLERHWKTILDRIPKVPLTQSTVANTLSALKQSNDSMSFTEASRTLLFTMLRKEADDERYVRSIIDELFGKHTYSRYKHNGREPPSGNQLKTLLHITDTITAMKPVRLSDYIYNVGK